VKDAGNSKQLGAFFAPQKTGLSGAPRSRAPAPATPWLNPSNPLRRQQWPLDAATNQLQARHFAYSKTPKTIALKQIYDPLIKRTFSIEQPLKPGVFRGYSQILNLALFYNNATTEAS
jgi:hypothetical protein